MNFSSINIQGNIISSEILDKIRSEEKYKHQSPEAFGLARTASLRDEIGMSWAIMRTHWQAYKKRLETLPKGDAGTTLTRERLIIPLLSELGYETIRQNAQIVNGKSYAISHSATNKNQYPIHIMGYNDHLDKRRESGGPRLSPHALVQEYLNNTEHLYALVTNGKQLRLLRDATRLVRMSYFEFDLERMFEEELYADFSLLFRVLHATRMPEKIEAGSESLIEYYHQESMASGTRIREKLSEAVEDSIKTLANGFLEHKNNTNLVQLFENKSITPNQYYTHQLRLIYRILFLIVLEERKLIYPEDLTEEQQRFRDIYHRYYSIERLRKLTENRVYVDADKYDLWESLKTTFLIFEYEEYGAKLGIKPLGSGLFAPDAIGTLKEQFLSNGNLIEVLKRLTTFVSEQKTLVRVNYSDLDVEEFGSIYEGLLEYDPKVEKISSKWEFSFVQGDGRSSSGSHYTPEELVKPLIKHSLDYIIADKLKEPNPEEALLSITVCDVACGSGHILLSAARKIATELASIREGAEQPSPTYYRAAICDVIRNCIYGVDLNPLAVELCKVALWLESHNPNEPLHFLDHHIKCGNAIVGLAHFEELDNGISSEAFIALSEKEKEKTALIEDKKGNYKEATWAALFKKTNDAERIDYESKQVSVFETSNLQNELKTIQQEYNHILNLPETTPEEITAKATAYKNLTEGKKWYRLKNLADLQVAQFFIPKTLENKEKLTTDKQYRKYLNSDSQIQDRGTAMAKAANKRFFHWFLEFPTVFQKGGFDCILGNPPYLGGKKLSGNYGDDFLNYLKMAYFPAGGQTDLVTYFLKRINNIIRLNCYFSIITTNSVSAGENRSNGLEIIINNGSEVIFAHPSIEWPGEANTFVTLFSIFKGQFSSQKWIKNKDVLSISSFLDDSDFKFKLLEKNQKKSFQGNNVLGKGFVINEKIKNNFVSEDKINIDVVFPYINGDDVNSSPSQEPSKWVVFFNNLTEIEAKKYLLVYEFIKRNVYPERQLKKDKGYREKWWLHARYAKDFYKITKKNKRILARTQASKYNVFTFLPNKYVFDQKLIVFSNETYQHFSILSSSIHEIWLDKVCGDLGGAAKNYSPTTVYSSFPFIIVNNNFLLNNIGEKYFEFRQKLLFSISLGLTKTYNQFHNKYLITPIEAIEAKAFQKKYGKETWNLYNHLEVKKEGNISYEEAVPLIFKLRELHKEMDEAVLDAYCWQDIDLRHDFYEVDYLPENDRVRYTIHPDARREILKRLLLLNHERYEEEIKQGLHKKEDVVAFYKQKNQEIPEGTVFSDGKVKRTIQVAAKKKKIAKPTLNPKVTQGDFFGTLSNNEIVIGSQIVIKRADNKYFKYHIIKNAVKGALTGDYKQIAPTSALSEIMLGRKVGDAFTFGEVQYKITEVE